MKRSTCLVLHLMAVVLIIALLSACGGDGGTTATEPSAPTGPPTQSADELAEQYDEIVSEIDFAYYVPSLSTFHLADISIGGTDEQPVVITVYHLNGDDEQRLTIFQSNGLVNHGMSGEIETVQVWGVDAQFSHNEDGLGVEIHDLSWDVDGRTFSISARGVPPETVLEFAESLEPYGASAE